MGPQQTRISGAATPAAWNALRKAEAPLMTRARNTPRHHITQPCLSRLLPLGSGHHSFQGAPSNSFQMLEAGGKAAQTAWTCAGGLPQACPRWSPLQQGLGG